MVTTLHGLEPAPVVQPVPAVSSRGWRHTAISVVVLLAAWEVCSRAGVVNELLSSRPSEVAAAAAETIPTKDFWRHFLVSGTELLVGFGLAIVIGVPFGLAAGWYRRLGYMVAPWLDAFNAVPRIALLPLVIIWLGIGIDSKIVLVFLSGVGLIALDTYLGVRTVSPLFLDVGRVFGASSLRRFAQIILPSTVPFILAGIRMGLGAAVIGVIFAESYGANEGLGFLMQASASSLQMGRYFLIVLVFTAIGAACFGVLALVERRIRARTPSEEG